MTHFHIICSSRYLCVTPDEQNLLGCCMVRKSHCTSLFLLFASAYQIILIKAVYLLLLFCTTVPDSTFTKLIALLLPASVGMPQYYFFMLACVEKMTTCYNIETVTDWKEQLLSWLKTNLWKKNVEIEFFLKYTSIGPRHTEVTFL